MEKEQTIDHAWKFGFGGMIREELEYMYDASKGKTILELGTEVGQCAYVMATVGSSVTCVDAWDDTYEHLNNDELQKRVYLDDQKSYQDKEVNKNNIFDQFKKNCQDFISSGTVKFIKGKTLDVVDQFENESFDLILIDADHSYEGVYNDINAYLPKLKPGGELLFHDYGCGMWTGVKEACDQCVNEGKLEFISQHLRVATFKQL